MLPSETDEAFLYLLSSEPDSKVFTGTYRESQRKRLQYEVFELCFCDILDSYRVRGMATSDEGDSLVTLKKTVVGDLQLNKKTSKLKWVLVRKPPTTFKSRINARILMQHFVVHCNKSFNIVATYTTIRACEHCVQYCHYTLFKWSWTMHL